MSAREHRGLLPSALLALCIAGGLQASVLRSQPPAGAAAQAIVVNGHQAVAGEVLVQYAEPADAVAGRASLEHQIAASENVAVGRRGLRRVRSRMFDVEEMLAFFRGQPGVVFAEPNYLLSANTTPNDPRFHELWGLLNVGQGLFGTFGTPGADINAPSAWSHSTGTRAHVVGIIDSGIDYSHPDLAANVWSAPAPFTVTIGGVTIDCPAGSHGFDAIVKTCDPMDTFGHGTHVAGSIGAVGNNGQGVTGVNWTASLIAGKFLDASGVGSTADAIDSIEFMLQVKAIFAASGGANIRVLNNSWGGGAFSTALRDAIAAAHAADVLFVASAGNGSTDTDLVPHYPASYDVPNVVAVAASTNQDFLWTFSNFGDSSVDLAAPGDFILSTVPGGTYGYRSGTSFAAPQVAGAAALVLSACELDSAALKETLLVNVDPVPALTGRVSSGGRLNVDRAMRSCVPPGIPSVPAGVIAVPGDETVTLAWRASGGATGYNVKRAAASGGPYVTVAAGFEGSTYSDTGLTNGTPYYYVVAAVNGFGESADSIEVSAVPRLSPPDPPASLETQPGDGRVRLEWTPSARATGYRVKRSLARSGPYALLAETADTTFTDESVVNGQKYFYIVTATNAAGESKNSPKASAFPAPVPDAPGGVVATTGVDPREIDLTWNAVAWATQYRVRRSDTSGGPYVSVGRFTTLAATDTRLKSGKRYFYVVTALNDSGESAGVEVSAIAR